MLALFLPRDFQHVSPRTFSPLRAGQKGRLVLDALWRRSVCLITRANEPIVSRPVLREAANGASAQEGAPLGV